MTRLSVDDRTPERKLLDEAIAAEAEGQLNLPPLPEDLEPRPYSKLMEEQELKAPRRDAMSFPAVVDGSVVRLRDSAVRLTDGMRVVVVAVHAPEDLPDLTTPASPARP